MTPLFQCELLNQPFDDPALYVRLSVERRALLFDAGDLCTTGAGKLLKIRDVFISHMHIDHFIGFDHLIRLNLARDTMLTFYGPPGIIRNVAGKLRGYTWNLVDGYRFVVEVVEIRPRSLRVVRFPCERGFRPGPAEVRPSDGTVHVRPHYRISALRLDHGTPSLAYGLQERYHININKQRLVSLGLPVGPWLSRLKQLIWEEAAEDTIMHPTPAESDRAVRRAWTLGELRHELVTITRGQKIIYIADCAGAETNLRRLISFASGADIVYCEAAFMDADRDKAAARRHLTARQAGEIAHLAGARDLRVFHFSPRYESAPQQVYGEARDAFLSGPAVRRP